MKHSMNVVSEELAVQVKRHREKRRKRREARAPICRAGDMPGAKPSSAPSSAEPQRRTRRRSRRAGRPSGAAPERYGSASVAASLGTLDLMSFLDRALRMGEAKKFKSYEQRVAQISGV